MARKFDFTRFVTSTIVNVTTFNFETMETEDETFTVNGELSNDDIKKEVVKRYGKAKINYSYTDGRMYGLTTDDVMYYGTELNPFTRQPWDDSETIISKHETIERYINEQKAKKEGVE